MALSSGTYIITSKVENYPVGRNLREDKSLRPKEVVILPQGVEAPKWELTALSDENLFTMKIGGGYATKINNLLFAILMEVPEPGVWKIEPQPHLGKNTYIITRPSSPEGWVVSDTEPEAQIHVQPLIVGPSFPPFFPPTELFEITKVD